MSRVHTPTVIQMEALECGAASLGIVLGYYGCNAPLEELRYECGVSRDGSKALNVLKAAKKYGLDGKGYKMTESQTPLDLLKKKLPLILFWENSHFLVLEGMGKNKFYLNDPAFGPRCVDEETFLRSFSGVYLELTPNESFRKSKKRSSLLSGLHSRLHDANSSIAFAFLVSISLMLPSIGIPALSKIFINDYLLKEEHRFFHPILAILALFLATSIALGWLQKTTLIKLEAKLNLTSSYNFMWHLLKLPLFFFSQRSSGNVISRLQANDKIASLLSDQLSLNLFNLLQVFFVGAFMLCFCWKLTLIVLFFAALNLIVFFSTRKIKRDVSFRLQEAEAKMIGTAMMGNFQIESLKASGGEGDYFNRWSGLQAKYVNAKQEQSWLEFFTGACPDFFSGLSSALVLGAAAYLVIEGQLTIGGLVAFGMLAVQFNAPINGLAQFGSSLQQIAVDISRLDDVQNFPVDAKFSRKEVEAKELPTSRKLCGTVELRNVSFGYSRLEPPLIENFNLKITPGARIALVGHSGCGKSTIAKLIAGFYEPWEGEILFDGIPIQDIPPEIIANSVSLVEQSPFFFKGSIKENLTMWDLSVPDEKITLAAKNAEIYEEVASRPGAFESEINENGDNFSGGQLQRLEIARALIPEPSVMIMDEGMSALDPILEERIDCNLRSQGIASLIIAHRLSTIRDSEEIIVMENGKIVERGYHDSLVKEQGYYFNLIQSE